MFDGIHHLQIVEPIHAGILHQAVYFQMPKLNVDARIDNVFGHAVKLVVWCDRLDDAAFVLQAVVTECRRAIKFARQGHATASQRDSNRAQDKCASPDRGSEFSIFGSNPWSCEKLKARYERSLENENAQREAHKCKETRGIDRQSDVTGAKHRPQQNRNGHDRKHDEDRDCPNCRWPMEISPCSKTENRAGDGADQQLPGDCRSNTELFEMIVAAHFAHERKKWPRRNKNRESIANNDQRRRYAKTRQQQHRHGHGSCRDRTSQQTGRERFNPGHYGGDYAL